MTRRRYRVDIGTGPDDHGRFLVHVHSGQVRLTLDQIKERIASGHDVAEYTKEQR